MRIRVFTFIVHKCNIHFQSSVLRIVIVNEGHGRVSIDFSNESKLQRKDRIGTLQQP